jgi:hypothetical protein
MQIAPPAISFQPLTLELKPWNRRFRSHPSLEAMGSSFRRRRDAQRVMVLLRTNPIETKKTLEEFGERLKASPPIMTVLSTGRALILCNDRPEN